MKILVTNDDGIRADGLGALVEVARSLGEVKVFAPDHERSACGHGMTLRDPLRLRPAKWDGIEAYEVTGLPVDCVNLGLAVGFADGCDLILSGINHGPNLGIDVTYSGTVAAAIEGAICGIRSIAFSMALFVDGAPLHMDTGRQWIQAHLTELLAMRLPVSSFLNINIPAIAFAEVEGHRYTALGRRVYAERIEHRTDPWGRDYYWQGGVVAMDEEQPDTDVDAIRRGYVTITPVTTDWTDVSVLSSLAKPAR